MKTAGLLRLQMKQIGRVKKKMMTKRKRKKKKGLEKPNA